MTNVLPWDALDREEEALRAWVTHYDRAGDYRMAETIERDIGKLWDMRGRRGWTSRFRREVPRYGVEAFGAVAPTRQAEHWTTEPELD